MLQPSRYSVFHSGDTPFDLVFHNRIVLVSILILKPLLGVIGAISLKLQASPIIGTHI